ncbi:MAG: NusG domain II-containing protein [Lachnospiraceae bacterium]|nr:NusG domain II-containing protein [Lachnospiraceae bacterium]
MSKKRFGKNDILFIGGILGIALLFMLLVFFLQNKEGACVEVTVDEKVYGTYDLNENQEIPITIDGEVTNVLTIKDGKAKMTDADCPDHLCMHQKAISKEKETIVCLPNKVVAEVTGSKEKQEFDSIAR